MAATLMGSGSVLATVRLSGVSSQKMAPPKASDVEKPPPAPHLFLLAIGTVQISYTAAAVLRCNPTDSQFQCSFFLWEVHESSARKRLQERSSQRPTTPNSTSTQANELYLPTPSTAGSASTPLAGRPGPQTLCDTPTRSRGKAVVPSSAVVDDEDDENDEDDKGSLLPQIIACFKADGVKIKPSTKEYLGHLLRQESAIYEAKLRSSEFTIARLRKQLDRLTVKGGH
ncbi:hypothetical protein VTI74DRAFT_8202 [Chaetomium olivicolor]